MSSGCCLLTVHRSLFRDCWLWAKDITISTTNSLTIIVMGFIGTIMIPQNGSFIPWNAWEWPPIWTHSHRTRLQKVNWIWRQSRYCWNGNILIMACPSTHYRFGRIYSGSKRWKWQSNRTECWWWRVESCLMSLPSSKRFVEIQFIFHWSYLLVTFANMSRVQPQGRHPGGKKVVISRNGKDVTGDFNGVVYNHTNAARNLMSHMRIARLSSKEHKQWRSRMFVFTAYTMSGSKRQNGEFAVSIWNYVNCCWNRFRLCSCLYIKDAVKMLKMCTWARLVLASSCTRKHLGECTFDHFVCSI